MGDINVYSGPMKCGKSQKIMDEARRQMIAGKKIQFFKPTLDTRFGNDCIKDRNGNTTYANNISKIDELEHYDADAYFIDEFQFLEGNIDCIKRMVSKGKKFYISGLTATSELKPFGKMGDLMCIADNINIMTSICEVCRNDNAVYNYYKGKKTTDIVLGDSEYLPVCRECYYKLINGEIQ